MTVEVRCHSFLLLLLAPFLLLGRVCVWGRFVDISSQCEFGKKSYTFAHVNNAKNGHQYIFTRCVKFQHSECVQSCQWTSACRNTGPWGKGKTSFVAGVRLRTKGTKPKVSTYQVKCCVSDTITILEKSCRWRGVPLSPYGDIQHIDYAHGNTQIIRDFKHVIQEGAVQFQLELCRVRQKWCVVRQLKTRYGFGYANITDKRLAKLIPRNVLGFPADEKESDQETATLNENQDYPQQEPKTHQPKVLSTSTGRKNRERHIENTPPPPLPAPRPQPRRSSTNQRRQQKRIRTRTRGSAVKRTRNRRVCAQLSIMSRGDITVTPSRPNSPSSAQITLGCREPEYEAGVLEREMEAEPELASDLALFPLALSKPLTAHCTKGGVWEVLGGVPLESDCTLRT